ncbi:MAG: hypothetical protein Q9195_009193 [Heterodermia aff. obscurata]
MEDQAIDTSLGSSNTPPPPSAPVSTSQPVTCDEQPSANTTESSTVVPSRTQPVSPPLEGTFTKRLLPESLSSAFPHGLITGEARSAVQQAALDARKSEILSTMTAEQIEEKYQETAKKVQDLLEEIRDGNEKVDKQIEDAKKTREMERRAWLGMKKAAAEGEI